MNIFTVSSNQRNLNRIKYFLKILSNILEGSWKPKLYLSFLKFYLLQCIQKPYD